MQYRPLPVTGDIDTGDNKGSIGLYTDGDMSDFIVHADDDDLLGNDDDAEADGGIGATGYLRTQQPPRKRVCRRENGGIVLGGTRIRGIRTKVGAMAYMVEDLQKMFCNYIGTIMRMVRMEGDHTLRYRHIAAAWEVRRAMQDMIRPIGEVNDMLCAYRLTRRHRAQEQQMQHKQ